ncbi:ABC transporter ATP-binding protein [Citreimonas sp.]|uniref:ABC transporter ATP-binding protein n=1 Tax=Citreimonas sp. TaxID=3036715 RepID=UPI0040580AB0
MSLAFLLERLWPYRAALALSLVLMLAESAAVLVVPWLGGQIVGGLISAVALPIGLLAGGLIALFALQAVLGIVRLRVLERTSETVSADLRAHLYDHLQRLPMDWLDDQRRGDMLALISREVDMLTQFVTGAVLGFLPKLIVLAGAIVLMLNLDPVLALPIVLGVPVFYVLLKLLGRNIRPLAGQIRDAYAQSVAIAEENLSVLPAIKSYVREDVEAARYADSVRRYRDLTLRLTAHEAVIGPLVRFIAAAAIVLVLWLGGESVARGQMTPSELVAFLLYAGLMTRPVAGLAELWAQFQHARGALRHMEAVLAVRPEPREGLAPAIPAKGAITVENLGFGYPGRPPLFSGVGFEIAAGEIVAVTGENGSGKTTLMDLLLRFRTPQSGRILLDGQDIAALDLKAYRAQMALVPQSMALIAGTIADNIRFGRPEATRAEIETAAREADAEGFVRELPDGLDTVIGEQGVRLSGGQRQRVALARALLKKPAILILDEPTSMFDPEGEARFVEAARAALKGRTVILITHRPASLVLADRIVRLGDHGQPSDTAVPQVRHA